MFGMETKSIKARGRPKGSKNHKPSEDSPLVKQPNLPPLPQVVIPGPNNSQTWEQYALDVLKRSRVEITVEPTPISQEVLNSKVEALRAEMLKQSEYYGAETLSERFVGFLSALLQAPDQQTFSVWEAKILEKLETSLRAKWASGELPGPLTAYNVEAKAKQKEHLAGLLEKHGNYEAAEKQRAKAAELRSSFSKKVE